MDIFACSLIIIILIMLKFDYNLSLQAISALATASAAIFASSSARISKRALENTFLPIVTIAIIPAEINPCGCRIKIENRGHEGHRIAKIIKIDGLQSFYMDCPSIPVTLLPGDHRDIKIEAKECGKMDRSEKIIIEFLDVNNKKHRVNGWLRCDDDPNMDGALRPGSIDLDYEWYV